MSIKCTQGDIYCYECEKQHNCPMNEVTYDE